MSRVLTVSAEAITMEITKPVTGFVPSDGQMFYVPDLLSLMAPVKSFEWKGSQTDYMLFYDNMVFPSEQDALERYHVLKTLIRFVDQT